MNESVKNILQALYESSEIIKTYVDSVADGNAVPYTILIRDTEVNKNSQIIDKLKDLLNSEHAFLNYSGRQWFEEFKELFPGEPIPVWALEEWPDLLKTSDPESTSDEFECVMFKDNAVVDGSRQIVNTEAQMENLRKYAEFKGYEITFNPVKKDGL